MNVDVSDVCSRPASPPTILPSFFFQDIVETKSLVSLFDFENRSGFFPDVDSRMKFCLFTAGSGPQPAADHVEFAFFTQAVEELRDPERRFTLSPEDISLLNPNTSTCPTFRSRRDAELAKAIYRRVPVLIREARDGMPKGNQWGIRFNRLFDMSNDSHLFHTREAARSRRLAVGGKRVSQGRDGVLALVRGEDDPSLRPPMGQLSYGRR